MRPAGSVGYGDRGKRDPELVRSDVLDGFTTLELAERSYGVVLEPETLADDIEGTRWTRSRRPTVPA